MTTGIIIFLLIIIGLGAVFVFQLIPSYLRRQKQRAEVARAHAEERAKQIKAEQEERDRKEILRRRDPDVDPIFRDLILAKLDLQRILRDIDEFDTKSSDVEKLWKWDQDHHGVMDFDVFIDIKKYFPPTDEEEPIFLKEQVEQLIEDHCDADTYLGYADAKLGIQRGYMNWDGLDCGGVSCEMGNGRYEDINDRLERILRKLPGTDRGYVYILTNSSFPGLIKIGKTHRSPEQRAEELSKHSGVPTPFVVSYKTIVSNCGLVETIVHQRLAAHRVADNREFFSMEVQQAVTFIEKVAQEQEAS